MNDIQRISFMKMKEMTASYSQIETIITKNSLGIVEAKKTIIVVAAILSLSAAIVIANENSFDEANATGGLSEKTVLVVDPYSYEDVDILNYILGRNNAFWADFETSFSDVDVICISPTDDLSTKIFSYSPDVIVISDANIKLWELNKNDNYEPLRDFTDDGGGLVITHGSFFDLVIDTPGENNLCIGPNKHDGLQDDYSIEFEGLCTQTGLGLLPIYEQLKVLTADVVESATGQPELGMAIRSIPLCVPYVPFNGIFEVENSSDSLLYDIPISSNKFSVNISCPMCKGNGDLSPDFDCWLCNGTGNIIGKECPLCHGHGHFGEFCFACDGTGNIFEGIKCPRCNGTGEANCTICDGTGHCPICSGDHHIDIPCGICDGDGKIGCPACDGTGICPVCGGQGEIEGPLGITYDCPFCGFGWPGDAGECGLCGGDGEINFQADCPFCGFGWPGDAGECGLCGGDGVWMGMQCPACKGDRECFFCNGEGEIDASCPACGGDGIFLSCLCPFCSDGSCPICNGDGKANIDIDCPFCIDGECPICDGDGVLADLFGGFTCPICSGSGICPICKGFNSIKVGCLLCGGDGNLTDPVDCPFCDKGIPHSLDCFYCGGTGSAPYTLVGWQLEYPERIAIQGLENFEETINETESLFSPIVHEYNNLMGELLLQVDSQDVKKKILEATEDLKEFFQSMLEARSNLPNITIQLPEITIGNYTLPEKEVNITLPAEIAEKVCSILKPAEIVATSTDGRAAILKYESPTHRSVYFTFKPEGTPNDVNMQLMYNAINWSSVSPPEPPMIEDMVVPQEVKDGYDDLQGQYSNFSDIFNTTGFVTEDGSSTFDFAIHSSGTLAGILTHPNGDIQFRFISPNGTEYNSTTDSEGNELVEVYNPESGVWNVKVEANSTESAIYELYRMEIKGESVVYVSPNQDPSWYDESHVKTIQEGINNVSVGGTVNVFNGTYYENVVINKTIDLIGEDRNTTIIDGGRNGNVIKIKDNRINISGFTIKKSGWTDQTGPAGIDVRSNYNTITGNIILNNSIGIQLLEDSPSNNTITGNNISSNNYCGILLGYSSNNTITGNNISSNNYCGIELRYSSNSNAITGNTISNNDEGIYLWGSSNNNNIYHNNFINNTQSADDECNNSWDNGYPSGGNYWDDFDEPNEGAYDNNSDGIVDSPYPIPGDSNQDRYPLMEPWNITPVTTFVNISPPTQTVSAGETFTVNITIDPGEPIAGAQADLLFDPSLITVNSVTDGGMFDMWFNANLEIDNVNGAVRNISAIDFGSVTTSGVFAIIEFTAGSIDGTSPLNLTNTIVGNPNGTAVSIMVNNGNVTVILYPDWDVNMDDSVNILDLIIVGQHWGETGDPGWIRADVNKDGVINILDLILIGQHWTG